MPPATEDACKGGPERMGMEAVGTWNVPTPLEEVHQDLETKERKKQLFYYHQANAAVNALGARVTEGASPPRTPCMCASGAGADRAPPPALLALVALAVVRAAAARPVARDAFRSRGVPTPPPLAAADARGIIVLPTKGTQGLSPGCALDAPVMDIVS